MTGEQSLVARTALAAGCAAAGVVVCGVKRFQRIPWPRFVAEVTAAFIASRLAIYFCVFFVLHIAVRGDIIGVYFPEAQSILRGQLPYRDFYSSYAPLHSFMDAALLHIWNDVRAIVFWPIIGDSLLFWLWLRLAKQLFPDATARTAALLYLTSALSLHFVAIDGQDTVLVALALTGALLLMLRRSYFLSGLVLGLSFCLLKFLPLMFVPLFLIALYGGPEVSPRTFNSSALKAPLCWIAGFLIVVIPTFAVVAYARLPFLQPLKLEAANRTAGNLPFLVESLTGHMFGSAVWDPLTILTLLVVFIAAARASYRAQPEDRIRALIFATAAATFALSGAAKKSWPAYLMLALFPICLIVAETIRERPAARLRELCMFGLFTIVALMAPSFWSSILRQVVSVDLHQTLMAGDVPSIFLVVLQVCLLIGYGLYFIRSLRLIASAPAPADTSRP